jgi:hypothetical protein
MHQKRTRIMSVAGSDATNSPIMPRLRGIQAGSLIDLGGVLPFPEEARQFPHPHMQIDQSQSCTCRTDPQL